MQRERNLVKKNCAKSLIWYLSKSGFGDWIGLSSGCSRKLYRKKWRWPVFGVWDGHNPGPGVGFLSRHVAGEGSSVCAHHRLRSAGGTHVDPRTSVSRRIAPNLFDSLGLYFSAVAVNTVWLVRAPFARKKKATVGLL